MKIQNNITLQGFYNLKIFDKCGKLRIDRDGHNLLMDRFVKNNYEFINFGTAPARVTLNACFGHCFITDALSAIAVQPAGTIDQVGTTVTSSEAFNFSPYVNQTIHLSGDTPGLYDAMITSAPVLGEAEVDRTQAFTLSSFIIADTYTDDITTNFTPTYNRPELPLSFNYREVQEDTGVLSVSTHFVFDKFNTDGSDWVINNVGFITNDSNNKEGDYLSSRFKVDTVTVSPLERVLIDYTLVSNRSLPDNNFSNHTIDGNFPTEGGARTLFQHRISSIPQLSAVTTSPEALAGEYCGFEFPTLKIGLSGTPISTSNTDVEDSVLLPVLTPNLYTISTSADAPNGSTTTYSVSTYYIRNVFTPSINYDYGNSIKLCEYGNYNAAPRTRTEISPVVGYELSWTGPSFTLEEDHFLKLVTEWNLRRIITD